MKKRYLLLLLTPLFVFGCKEKNNKSESFTTRLNSTVAIEKKINTPMVFVGQSQPNFLYTTQPRINGYLLRRNFDSGTLVKKGQLIYEIDPSQYIIAMAQAKADVAASVAQEKQAKSSYDRNLPLSKTGAVSLSTLDESTAQWLSAKEAVKAKQAALKQAELNLSYTKIYAPADGIASVTKPSPGDFVGVGTQFPVLNEIWRTDTIAVTVSIPMSTYLKVSQNSEFSSSSYQNESLLSNIKMQLSDDSFYPIEGSYLYTKSSVNSKSDAIELVTMFPNPQRALKAGQYVKIHCNVGEPINRILLPQNAIFRTQNVSLVYVVGPDSIVSIRNVETDGTWGDYWVVKSGLNVGERVLTEGFYKVRNGMKVEINSTDKQTTL